MNKKLVGFIGIFLFILLVGGFFVNAQNEVNVYYFYSTGCSHCANVAASGVLERVSNLSNVNLQKYDVFSLQENRDIFNNFSSIVGIPEQNRGWPLAVIEQNGKYAYLLGDTPIINELEDKVLNFTGVEPVIPEPTPNKGITLGGVIVAALIDSINPCAFGVLIFLMASMLRMGSAKRALRAGIWYSIVIFIAYFLLGVFLYKVIATFSAHPLFYIFYIIVAAIIFILALIQLKDVFWHGKGVSLKIPERTKPILERFINKGTFGAILILGVLVALFELPCTGEVYLGILTIMSASKTFGIGYLLIYNLIFILPLLVLTYLIYKGINTEVLHAWTTKHKRWMKLASGVLLVALAIYIFIISMRFL